MKKIIVLVLVLVLMFSLCAPALADSEKPYEYLAIGDSTVNGYNSDEFELMGLSGLRCGENPGIYPNLMADYLRDTLDREVNVNCILPEGIRAIDLRAVLDPSFVGDKYCVDHIRQWSDRYGDYDQLHATFCDAIRNADLMTVDILMSALGNYFSDRTKCALGLNDKDYDSYFGSDLLANYTMGKYGAVVNSLIACRGSATAMLSNFGLPTETVTRLIDTFEYTVGALMISFTESVRMIYELNDDIQLIVMSPFVTTSYDLTLTVGGISISLASFLRLYLGVLYDYIINLDPNHDRYKLADMFHSNLRCFTDGIADGEWDRYLYVTEEIRGKLLGAGIPVDGNDPAQEQYFRETVCPNVEKALADTRFDLNITGPELLDLVLSIISGGLDADIMGSLVKRAVEDYDSATDLEQLVLRALFVLESWGCHPDYSGHQQKFEAICKVFDKPYTAQYTYVAAAKSACEKLVTTVFTGGSIVSAVSDLLINSRLGVVMPRLFGR